MATVGANGWPYIQHRGGPKGFLATLDDRTIGFADFRGNKQYITTGNLMTDDRVALILMDYPRQLRLKILGRAAIHEGDAAQPWLHRLRHPDYKAAIERVIVISVEALDWNCQQHIHPRYTTEEIREVLAPVEQTMQELQQENQELKLELARIRDTLRSN
jgi:predicted pyridoxine 5'-phosphate oxidase superfamily flavin-nucleotide-binding protein